MRYYSATMRYWPNPAHKRRTSEAGPALWRPGKTPCPDDMTVAERNELLATAVPERRDDPRSRRYNVRRGARGLELYDFKWMRDVDGEPEFHGHPTTFLQGQILRELLAAGTITDAEYERLRKWQIP